jgi:hypothetical protein
VIVVENNHRPVAVIRAPKRSGRLLSECIALAKVRGSTVTLDEGFAKDMEDGIRERSKLVADSNRKLFNHNAFPSVAPASALCYKQAWTRRQPYASTPASMK